MINAGKTIQSIAFLASLFEEKISPHLVIAPLSTLRNWEREFITWAPQINVVSGIFFSFCRNEIVHVLVSNYMDMVQVMYFGSAQARAVIRNYEFFMPKGKTKKHKKKKSFKDAKLKKQPKRTKFDVLLTSYEMINMDAASLKSINWKCMVFSCLPASLILLVNTLVCVHLLCNLDRCCYRYRL